MSNPNEGPILLALSRLNEWFKCPRSFYWNYEYKGAGIAGTRTPIELAIGGAVHAGLQALLHGVAVDNAVAAGGLRFKERLQKGPAILEPNEDVLFVYKEQELLIEALIRVWALKGLPELLETYEIVEIEQENDLKLGPNVIIRTRADGLLRHRENGRLYVLSFKTAKRYDSRYGSAGGHDVQGLSEAAAIEQAMGEEVLGVQYQYIIKGARNEFPKGTGRHQQDNILLHPWIKIGTGENGVPPELATEWKWTDETGHGHTLGKGWRKCNIWDYMSVQDWIQTLSSDNWKSPFGPNADRAGALDEVLVTPPPYFRRRAELDDWKEQTRFLGEELRAKRGRMLGTESQSLNEHYPQNRRACDWPSKCPFTMICHGPAGPEPEQSGLYRLRREWKVDPEVESN